MKGAYTNDYYDRLKIEQRRRTRGVAYPFGSVHRFRVTSDSGNRRMQPRRELLRCGFFAPFLGVDTIQDDSIPNYMIKEKTNYDNQIGSYK